MKSFMIHCKAKEITNKITDHFKESLIECIEEHGRTALIVIKESQKLDRLIVNEMKKATGTPTKVVQMA